MTYTQLPSYPMVMVMMPLLRMSDMKRMTTSNSSAVCKICGLQSFVFRPLMAPRMSLTGLRTLPLFSRNWSPFRWQQTLWPDLPSLWWCQAMVYPATSAYQGHLCYITWCPSAMLQTHQPEDRCPCLPLYNETKPCTIFQRLCKTEATEGQSH